MKDPSDNLKKSFINKLAVKNNNTVNNNLQNNNTNTILRASIGNNVNNKMLNNNLQNNARIQFNNSMKVLTSSKIYSNNNIINIKNQKDMNLINKEVDLRYNFKSKGKDLVNYNNNILYNIYNNMNNNNNINSSFYKDLNKSFAHAQENPNPLFINNINDIPPIRKGARNIDNNMSDSNIVPIANTNLNSNNVKSVNNIPIQNLNQNINNKPIVYQNNNNYPKDNNQYIQAVNQKPIINQAISEKQIINKNIIPKQIITNPAVIINNQSFHTAPIQRNVVLIPNNDPKINKNVLFNNINRKTYNFPKDNNNMKLSISEESDEENNDISIDEYDKDGTRPYRFKNLLIHGPKKVKGNLEKFQKNQNIGNYLPTGTKFVSYLKFPDTKKNISNKSLTLSTISSSITSGSNRVIGIEKNIIKHPGELDEISSRIQRILNKKNIKYKILFRSNIDGDAATVFHEKCDKIKNTLILIKASGNKRFGGFTTETWDGNDINKKDEKSFIFSIDKMKIYDIIPGENAINCNPDLGPVFLGQIKLLDNFFTQGGTTSTKGKNFKTLEDFEITDGAEKFGVQEVEVYQIK